MKNYNEKITIIIVLYKENYELIYKTLSKLNSFKKIIIDNANNLELMNQIKSEFIIDKYILNKKNNGFSAGYNQGIKLNETEYSLILGPDCIISDRDIEYLYKRLNDYSECVITVPTAYDQNKKISYSAGPLTGNQYKDLILSLDGDICVESALGACMLFRTKEFIDLGLFDEIFFLYYSDIDFCRKIKLKKKSIIQVYYSKCFHVHGQIKFGNDFLKTFVRENNFTCDRLCYYYKIRENHEIKSFKKKIFSYSIKVFTKLLKLQFLDALKIFSRIYGYFRFLYKKNKIYL